MIEYRHPTCCAETGNCATRALRRRAVRVGRDAMPIFFTCAVPLHIHCLTLNEAHQRYSRPRRRTLRCRDRVTVVSDCGAFKAKSVSESRTAAAVGLPI